MSHSTNEINIVYMQNRMISQKSANELKKLTWTPTKRILKRVRNTNNVQTGVRQLSGRCQAVVKQFCIPQTVVSQSSCQALVRQFVTQVFMQFCIHQAVGRQSDAVYMPSSGIHQAVVSQSSISNQKVIKQNQRNSHQAVRERS